MIIKTTQRERGFITMVVLILLALMLIFAAMATASSYRLRREVRAVEKQQLHRLAPPPRPAK